MSCPRCGAQLAIRDIVVVKSPPHLYATGLVAFARVVVGGLILDGGGIAFMQEPRWPCGLRRSADGFSARVGAHLPARDETGESVCMPCAD